MISFIVPAYAEAQNLPRLIKEFYLAFKGREDFEIIIVNDGNPDNSVEIIKELENEYDKVKCLFNDDKRGKTKAIIDGFKESIGNIVVLIDADLQYSPYDIPNLIENLKYADFVNGLRVNRKDNITRKIQSKVYNFLIRLFFNMKISDCNSGLKVFKRIFMEKTVDHLKNGWHRYLPVLAEKKGYRVKEVEIRHFARTKGNSKFTSPTKLFRGFIDLLSVKAHVLKHKTISEVRLEDYCENLVLIEHRTSNLEKYLTKNPLKRKIVERFMSKIISLVSAQRNTTILDAGCGEGQMLYYLRKALPDAEIIGLDISINSLKIAKNLVNNTNFTMGDIQNLPFRDNSSKTILCLEVIEHTENPSAFLDELYRVLEDGYLILSVPHSLLFRLGNLLTMKNIGNLGEDKDHISRFDKSRLTSLLKGRFDKLKIVKSSVWLIAICERASSRW